jgi:hypothetical protein
MQKPTVNGPALFTVVLDTTPNEYSVWSMYNLFACPNNFDIRFSNGRGVWTSDLIIAEIRGCSVWFRVLTEKENKDDIDIGLVAFNEAGKASVEIHVDVRHPFSSDLFTSENKHFRHGAHRSEIIDVDAL